MKIAIIGAGFTGLSAAYRLLQKGHDVTIFEKDSEPGGLAIGYQEKGWDWSLEKYYHHWFTNDTSVLNLAKEINYPVLIRRPKTSVYIDNKIYQLDSIPSLLTFKKLAVHERIRMGVVLGFLKFNPFWKPLEKFHANSVLPKAMGKKAYEMIWEPLLVAKFGQYMPTISLAWFWARITKRTPSLAYPEGGFLKFANALSKKIESMGGKIYFNSNIEKIEDQEGYPNVILGSTPGRTTPESKKKTDSGQARMTNLSFDKVIVTLPSFAFIQLAPSLPEDYKKELSSLQGIGAVILVLRLKKPFFKENTYWLSVCDKNAPVLAIVEHTNFMDQKHYNNEHLVYLGNYLPKEHRYFTLTKEELLKEFDQYLEKISPEYKESIIGFQKFSVPFAQPIIPINYSKMIPPFETPLKNVYLANMQQVYPWDRGTNYAVELGEKIAKIISNY